MPRVCGRIRKVHLAVPPAAVLCSNRPHHHDSRFAANTGLGALLPERSSATPTHLHWVDEDGRNLVGQPRSIQNYIVPGAYTTSLEHDGTRRSPTATSRPHHG